MRGDQMPGHQPAQRPGTTGHHHTTRTHTPDQGILVSDPDKPGHLDQPVPQPDLPLTTSSGLLQQTHQIPKLPAPRTQI
ncbi:hypothetical protein LO762_32180, partial [Actinocorallia sp. API 0066]|uniref:hypothetical protein n=1 Tax=Actinocorallia sp. API 0066 TaxID=2896846 RepID=UPI001E582FEB